MNILKLHEISGSSENIVDFKKKKKKKKKKQTRKLTLLFHCFLWKWKERIHFEVL